MEFKRSIIWVFLALLATSCGWQPRGYLMPPLDIDSVRIVSNEQHTELLRELEQSLLSQDIKVVEKGAEYTIALGDEQLNRRTVGIGNDSLAAAYELTLALDYQLRDEHNAVIGKPERVQVRRSYDASDTTGLDREQDMLLEDMRRELVQQIIRRSYFVLQDQQATQAPQ